MFFFNLYLTTYLTDPFNCNVTYQCDLAWLVRSNRHWLNEYSGPVVGAKCSNGTSFYGLNPNALRTPLGKPCP